MMLQKEEILNTPYQSYVTPSSVNEFSRQSGCLCVLFERLKGLRETDLERDLLYVGKEVRGGSRLWTMQDLSKILHWKHIEPLKPKIERQGSGIESILADAFEIEDEEGRIEALCRIQGIGPVLASVLLTLTFPEKYAPLDSHAWNGLRRIGFELPRHPLSGGGYTISEFLRYTHIIKQLAEIANTTPWEVAKALHALHKITMTRKWQQEWVSQDA